MTLVTYVMAAYLSKIHLEFFLTERPDAIYKTWFIMSIFYLTINSKQKLQDMHIFPKIAWTAKKTVHWKWPVPCSDSQM